MDTIIYISITKELYLDLEDIGCLGKVGQSGIETKINITWWYFINHFRDYLKLYCVELFGVLICMSQENRAAGVHIFEFYILAADANISESDAKYYLL